MNTQAQQTYSSQHAAAFTLWETRFRDNAAEFMTMEEVQAMEVATLGERSAIFFSALLREVGPAPIGTQPTIHYPRPAIVSRGAGNTWQRRFGAVATGSNYCPPLNIKNPASSTEIEVFRSAHDDFARVDVQVGHPSLVNLWLRLTPADLRDLAARLIDAAHDIEAFPAATLAEAAPEGGVA